MALEQNPEARGSIHGGAHWSTFPDPWPNDVDANLPEAVARVMQFALEIPGVVHVKLFQAVDIKSGDAHFHFGACGQRGI